MAATGLDTIERHVKWSSLVVYRNKVKAAVLAVDMSDELADLSFQFG